MPQGLPGFKEPPDGYVYGKLGELHRTASPLGGTLWLKMRDDTLNTGWTKVSGAYIPPEPSPTPTPTVSITPTMTPTMTVTPTRTPTYTPTPTVTATVTPSSVPQATPTVTPTGTNTTWTGAGIYRTWYNSSDCTGTSFYQEITPNCSFYFNHTAGGTTMYPDVPGYPDHLPSTDPVWSCRMSASLYVSDTDNYYFAVDVDDSVSVYIDGTLRFTGDSTQSLSAGWHPFEVRYSNIACCYSKLSIQWKRETGGNYHEMYEFDNPFGPISFFSVHGPAAPNGIVSGYGWGIYSANTVVDVGLVMDPEWTFVSWSGAESVTIEPGYDWFSNPVKIRTYEPGVNGCSITAATRYVGIVSPTPTATPAVTPTPLPVESCTRVALYSDSYTGDFEFYWTECNGAESETGAGSTYQATHIKIADVCVRDGTLNIVNGTAEYGSAC